MRPHVQPAAEAEILDAMLWYEDHAGLGRKFHDAVGATIESIGRAPLRFPKYEGTTLSRVARRARVGRFPYYVIYRYEPGDEFADVIAVTHERRLPGYWADRG